MVREIHITPDVTYLITRHSDFFEGLGSQERWRPETITVEVRHPAPIPEELDQWLEKRNKMATQEIVPMQVLVEAYQRAVLRGH